MRVEGPGSGASAPVVPVNASTTTATTTRAAQAAMPVADLGSTLATVKKLHFAPNYAAIDAAFEELFELGPTAGKRTTTVK